MNAESLRRTVESLLHIAEHRNDQWALKLSSLLSELRIRGLGSETFEFSEPLIIPELKEGNVYRPIASYRLEDRVVIGQCASYLRSLLDPCFLDCSFAFRAKPRGVKCPQHHDAVAALIDYRKRFDGVGVWVAECDIRGFFDCVDHQIAKECYLDAVRRVSEMGFSIDGRASEIFNAFLRSYSFERVAKVGAQSWFDNHDRDGKLKWPESELAKFHGDILKHDIGVPQGGALSCLIANLMLDTADRAVLNFQASEKRDPDLFYARYCDDMILIHPDRTKCEEAFDRYQRSLADLKLPVHAPKSVESYDRSFWSHKSKNAYLWASKSSPACVPWIAFVGYQLRYDGCVRIRPSSVAKELRKQITVADSVLKAVRPVSRTSTNGGYAASYCPMTARTRGQILYRLRQRLLSMSVGRRGLSTHAEARDEFCWTAGFRLLRDQPFVKSQIKQLDRGRERQLRRVKRALAALDVNVEGVFKGKAHRYDGHPLSYFGQFAPNQPVQGDDPSEDGN